MLRGLELILLLLTTAALPKYVETGSQAWDYKSAGKIEVRVRSGNVRVFPATDENRVSLSYTTRSNHSDFTSKVQFHFEVHPSGAVLTVDEPRGGMVDLDLKVPSRTDISVRITGGDVVIGDLEGDKEVDTHGGDITLLIPQPLRYSTVKASTRVGDIQSELGSIKGLIGKSLNFQSNGKYRIQAHTTAGDIHVFRSSSF